MEEIIISYIPIRGQDFAAFSTIAKALADRMRPAGLI